MKKIIKKLYWSLYSMRVKDSMKRYPDVWGYYLTHCNEFNTDENFWKIFRRIKKKLGY